MLYGTNVLGKDGGGGSIPLHGTIFSVVYQYLAYSPVLLPSANLCRTAQQHEEIPGEPLGEDVRQPFRFYCDVGIPAGGILKEGRPK